jgi:CRISPR system Cascade subunit CasB
VWAITLGDLPEQLTDLRAEGPTAAEQASHAAIVLYALHQQGHRGEDVHRRGVRLGSAVGQLARARAQGEDLDRSVVQRFHQVALANEFTARLYFLRGLVLLMRAEKGIALDYGLLAADLGRLADQRADHVGVLTRWGRDLHYKPAPTTPSTTEETK